MAAYDNTTLSLSQGDKLLAYAKGCVESCKDDLQIFRSMLEHRDRVYQRSLYVTQEQIRARNAALGSKRPRMSEMDVPIAMPQVETATAYQAGVFCTSYPIFGVVAENNPNAQGVALQFETVLAQQSMRHGWARELIKIFRDGNKYNFGVGVVTWVSENLNKITTSTNTATAGKAAIENYTYGANQIKHVSAYNCFMDFRVPASDICRDGEFFGYNELMSRIKLKKFLATLDPTKTRRFNEAFNSCFARVTSTVFDFHVPQVNPHVVLRNQHSYDTDWSEYMGLDNDDGKKIDYKSNYLVTHFYCRALPSDFGAAGNNPEVYHAIIINWEYVVFVERIVSAHNLLPAFIAQPDEDGLSYQTQSSIDISEGFQDMSSSLWNITLEGKRRAIFDRLIYNPKMINKADIDPANPMARVPLRNAAMSGERSMAQAIYQIPYRDDNSMAGVQLAGEVSKLADEATGQNRVSRGQFQKGNKTTAEFETTQGNSNARQQLRCMSLEHSFMSPVKEVIKANTLQFQTSTSILNQEKRKAVEVDPVALRKAMLEFTLTDGVLPADKILSPEMMQVFLQTMQAIPTLMTEYDVMGMFTWWLHAKGAKWLDTFKRSPEQQQQFLQMSQQTAQADPRVVAQQAQAQAQAQAQGQQQITAG